MNVVQLELRLYKACYFIKTQEVVIYADVQSHFR